MRIVVFAAIVLFSGLGQRSLDAQRPQREQSLVLEFHDGRKVRGNFAGVESGERLWLIHREAGIELRSGYKLELIHRVLVNGQPVLLASLEKEQASQTPAWKIPAQDPPLVLAHGPFIPAVASKVVSLDVLAEPANWDADPEADGLRLHLTPRDAFGRTVPVRGQLSAVLETRRLVPGPIPERSDRAPKVELERWGQLLGPEDFGPFGVIVELPFDGRREDLRGLGVPFTLTVRLGIPGQDVLEAKTPVPVGLSLP